MPGISPVASGPALGRRDRPAGGQSAVVRGMRSGSLAGMKPTKPQQWAAAVYRAKAAGASPLRPLRPLRRARVVVLPLVPPPLPTNPSRFSFLIPPSPRPPSLRTWRVPPAIALHPLLRPLCRPQPRLRHVQAKDLLLCGGIVAGVTAVCNATPPVVDPFIHIVAYAIWLGSNVWNSLFVGAYVLAVVVVIIVVAVASHVTSCCLRRVFLVQHARGYAMSGSTREAHCTGTTQPDRRTPTLAARPAHPKARAHLTAASSPHHCTPLTRALLSATAAAAAPPPPPRCPPSAAPVPSRPVLHMILASPST